jgi:glycosyltransferase involved in cell wall biosynthesis
MDFNASKDFLISVVVPIYNVAAYLRKCVDSILAQTHQNLEVILVDDGSPDECPAICEEYAKKDARIKVVHKQNGGLASARNAGIDIAQGEYLGFVDSDDWVDADMFELLLQANLENGTDIAVCGHIKESESHSEVSTHEAQVIEAKDYCKLNLQGKCSGMFWDKLYHKNIFDEFRPQEIYSSEDLLALPAVMERAHKVSVISATPYHFIQRMGSLSRHKEFRPRIVQDRLDAYQEWFKMAQNEQWSEADLLWLEGKLAMTCWDYLCLLHEAKTEQKSYEKEFIDTIRKYRAAIQPHICKMRHQTEFMFLKMLAWGVPAQVVLPARKLAQIAYHLTHRRA